MFDRCCAQRKTIDYKIIHNPKPISFSSDMDKMIKELLWYAPNIDSFQAKKNDLIEDKLYNDFSFTYILNKMGMDENRDVKWIEPNNNIDDDDWNYYLDRICCNCQKIIISRCKSLSKTNDLLRCLRNSIAHGHFAVIDDYIIGFNLQSTKKDPEGNKKAVIKLQPQLLLDALKSLSSPTAKVLLVRYAFERVGYTVTPVPANLPSYDLLIEKNGKQYAIEIKQYHGESYLHLKDLDRFLSVSEYVYPGIEQILYIDTARMTKAVIERVREIDNLRIIDIALIKQLLNENPVDILLHS